MKGIFTYDRWGMLQRFVGKLVEFVHGEIGTIYIYVKKNIFFSKTTKCQQSSRQVPA